MSDPVADSLDDLGNPARPVRDEDAFDVAAVAAWLGRGPIAQVEQYAGGASNLTYRLVMEADDEPDLVLRRPPAGTKAASAHDMGREHDVQAALAPVFPPVPRMVGLCTDPAVLGSDFYVMERVAGTVLRTRLPDDLGPEGADALCAAALDVLVDLHRVDVPAVPELAALARGEGYVARQVDGWTRRFADARTDDTGDWSDVTGWLAAQQPADVGSCLVHGDYRLDNLVLDLADPAAPRVRAVLDWELATVGDPLLDLGCALAYWVQADDDEVFQLFRRQPSHAPGMWTRRQLVEAYAARTGLTIAEDGWAFYEVFGLFRLAVIAQQIWRRYVAGQTSNPAFESFGLAVGYLETRCRGLVDAVGPTAGA